MNVPILIVIFKRPDATEKLISTLEKVRPSVLYIAADGPRENKPEEKDLTDRTREIAKNITWPCEIHTLFRDKNVGCKIAVSSAINWFFENVEEGIILEDDCIPNESFFSFCEEMLNRYRDNDVVMHINGSNFQFGEKYGKGSYYFSRCPSVWGWATWKRAWNKYDIDMKNLNQFISQKKSLKLFNNKKVANFWNSLFTHIKIKNIDTWDAQWVYSVMNNAGLVITPNVNLIKNIGSGEEATHTKQATLGINQETLPIGNLQHPDTTTHEITADVRMVKKMYIKPLWYKILFKTLNFFRN